jgi:hypothetical protein
MSIGTIKNRVDKAVEQAQKINQTENFKSIEVSLLDEIFQGNKPVLTGVDAHFTYCFLHRSFKKTRTQQRADRIESLAKQLVLPDICPLY